MKDTMLRLPAQCAALTPEEQLLVEGGAPAWMHTMVRRAKDVLRPYKPFIKESIKATFTIMAAFVNIMLEVNVSKDAAKELKYWTQDVL